MWDIPVFDLDYDDKEREAVLKVLDGRWLTMGSRTVAFEDRMKDLLGGDVHCCALSSCTAALHIAMLLAGVGPGDEVVVPSLTFAADFNVVVLCGATPVFADCVSLDDWNISPEDVARKITPGTKAVIALHYAGYPCDMAPLIKLCRERGIILIEDAAHATGASYRGRMCGTLGDMGCFSFFSNKNLVTGEGGMLTLHSDDLYRRANLFRCHGMTSQTAERHVGRAMSYDVVQPGLNYRFDEMRAALGLVQLEKLGENNAKRKALTNLYRDLLRDAGGVAYPWPQDPPETNPAYHIFPVLPPKGTDRAEFMGFMRENGIQTSVHYPFPGEMSYYKDVMTTDAPMAREISSRTVTLPLYPSMSPDMVEFVANQVKRYFGAA